MLAKTRKERSRRTDRKATTKRITCLVAATVVLVFATAAPSVSTFIELLKIGPPTRAVPTETERL